MDENNQSQGEGSEAPTPPTAPPPVQGPSSSNDQPDAVTGLEQNKLMAILSYLGILVLVPLIMKRDDPFVMYHAKQGLVIFIGYIIAALAVGWIPVLGNLASLVFVIISIIGIVQAAQGKRWKIPIITDIASKFNI